VANQNALMSFFRGFGQAFGYLGGGWYPSGATDGSPPFRTVTSDSGQIVSGGAAMQLAAVFACVRLIAETVATIPIELKQPDPTGKLMLAPNSRTYQMLAYAPNADMTAVEFWEMMLASMCLWGNAYALKSKISGRVVALIPFRPEFMTVFRNAQGAIQYSYMRGATKELYNADDMLHIKGFGIDGLTGASPVLFGRQTIGRSIATDQASGNVFRSGMSASGFISYDKALTPAIREEVRASVEKFTGSANAGKTMVLENGMTYKGMSMNPDDAQLLETRVFNVEEVCRWFGVPPVLIGQVAKSSSWASSLENTTLGWIKFGLRAYLVRIEQALTRALNPAPGTVICFNLKELERGDLASRTAYNASAAQNGYATRNEIRGWEGLPPSDEPNANALTVQLNLSPLDKLGVTPPAQGSPDLPNETEVAK
jgi:HK97 family phage portal protein